MLGHSLLTGIDMSTSVNLKETVGEEYSLLGSILQEDLQLEIQDLFPLEGRYLQVSHQGRTILQIPLETMSLMRVMMITRTIELQ